MDKMIHHNAAVRAYTARKETMAGRDHMVVPATLLVEGVHCGLQGCYHYSPELLAQVAPLWNGIPIPVRHPMLPDGVPGSCRVPEGWSGVVGHVFNSHVEGDALKAELWLERESLERHDPLLLERIERGEFIEVSTGFFPTETGPGGVWNEEEYAATIISLHPDHLAILPDEVGACSVADGCGIRNQEGESSMPEEIQDNVNNPSYNGTEITPWGNVDKSLGAYIAGYYKHSGAEKPSPAPTGIADLPPAAKTWIASKTLNGKAAATTGGELISYPVVNPNTNKLNKAALIAAKGRATQQGETALASRADSLLKSKFKITQSALVKLNAMALNEMSLTDVEDRLRQTVDRMDTPNKMYLLREVFKDYLIFEERPLGPAVSPDGTGQPKLYKAGYTVNEADGSVALGDPVPVQRKVDYLPITQAAPCSNQSPGAEEMRTNAAHKEVVMAEEKKCPVSALIESGQWKEEDRVGLLKVPPAVLTRMVEGLPVPKPNAPPAPSPAPERPIAANVAEPKKEPLNLNEFLMTLPADAREVINSGIALHTQRKAELIGKITGAPGNKFTAEVLNAKSMVDLEGIAALIQAPEPVNFFGLQAGVVNATPKDNDDDPGPLTAPSMADMFPRRVAGGQK